MSSSVDTSATVVAPAAASPSSSTSITYPPLSSASLSTGLITIIGFGSLLSTRSASFTFSTLHNFRPGLIYGWRRIFAHIAPVFIERGIANRETKEMSSLSVEPCECGEKEKDDAPLRVSVFEIPIADLPAFYAREMEFRWVTTPVYEPNSTANNRVLDKQAIDSCGLLCAAYTDIEYRRDRLHSSSSAYHAAYGRFGVDKIWRDDLLPCRVYLRHVVLAAAKMDQIFFLEKKSKEKKEQERIEWCDDAAAAAPSSSSDSISSAVQPASSATITNSHLLVSPHHISLPVGPTLASFLDSTYLGDRRTTIRQYIVGTQVGREIMCTQPPDEFKERYNG